MSQLGELTYRVKNGDGVSFENIQRLGVNMPGFLEKYLDEIRNKIEKKK